MKTNRNSNNEHGSNRVTIMVALIAAGAMITAALIGLISVWYKPEILFKECKPRGKEVTFSGADTSKDSTIEAGPYLHNNGIDLGENLVPAKSMLVIINNRAIYHGRAILPKESRNFLTQTDTDNGPASFVLVFPKPLDSISFIRPALYPASEAGITHPSWRARALDRKGNELSSCGEILTMSFKDEPPQTYTLRAPGFEGISSVKFESDPRVNGKPFAAFSGIVIESFYLVPRSKEYQQLLIDKKLILP